VKRVLGGIGVMILLILIGCGKEKSKEPEKPMLKAGDVQKIKSRIASGYYTVRDIEDDGNIVKVVIAFPPKPPADYMIANIANETCENVVLYLGKTEFRGRGVWVTAIAIDTSKVERTVGKSIYDPKTNKIEWQAAKKEG